ncbi:DUF3822 family protein [Flavitalea sp. BT771]|uniref:DUF3822 family protein n=1 Tax=Flavitalea sp. BT771 TaxID=3063329 RepID=UPI0026E17CAF|nr:DUF3822 family protein [Flavitalea sp. BT771]MDO6434672.1 DUF3822 family protein [Flavitalea sp. BT771]MDV6223572.1 DUF3822 family protein [Flavitalea sp. BT771]
MLKPAFQIEVPEIPDEDLLQCRLLVEVNAHSFTYTLLNQRNMGPMVVKYFQLDQEKNKPLTETLREILEGEPLFKRTVKETLLIYNFPESSLVPEPLFSMDTNKEVIDMLHGNLQKGLVLSEKIPWWELFNVYRISPELHHLLQQQFTAGKYWHYYSLLLKSYKMFDSSDGQDCLKVIFYPDKMVALLVKKGKVHLMQTFPYQDARDVVYHLLNACRQLDIDPLKIKVLVGGLIDRQSALSEELHKYFLQVSFEMIDESIKVTDELKELPLHYFSSILKMAVCA